MDQTSSDVTALDQSKFVVQIRAMYRASSSNLYYNISIVVS